MQLHSPPPPQKTVKAKKEAETNSTMLPLPIQRREGVSAMAINYLTHVPPGANSAPPHRIFSIR